MLSLLIGLSASTTATFCGYGYNTSSCPSGSTPVTLTWGTGGVSSQLEGYDVVIYVIGTNSSSQLKIDYSNLNNISSLTVISLDNQTQYFYVPSVTYTTDYDYIQFITLSMTDIHLTLQFSSSMSSYVANIITYTAVDSLISVLDNTSASQGPDLSVYGILTTDCESLANYSSISAPYMTYFTDALNPSIFNQTCKFYISSNVYGTDTLTLTLAANIVSIAERMDYESPSTLLCPGLRFTDNSSNSVTIYWTLSNTNDQSVVIYNYNASAVTYTGNFYFVNSVHWDSITYTSYVENANFTLSGYFNATHGKSTNAFTMNFWNDTWLTYNCSHNSTSAGNITYFKVDNHEMHLTFDAKTSEALSITVADTGYLTYYPDGVSTVYTIGDMTVQKQSTNTTFEIEFANSGACDFIIDGILTFRNTSIPTFVYNNIMNSTFAFGRWRFEYEYTNGSTTTYPDLPSLPDEEFPYVFKMSPTLGMPRFKFLNNPPIVPMDNNILFLIKPYDEDGNIINGIGSTPPSDAVMQKFYSLYSSFDFITFEGGLPYNATNISYAPYASFDTYGAHGFYTTKSIINCTLVNSSGNYTIHISIPESQKRYNLPVDACYDIDDTGLCPSTYLQIKYNQISDIVLNYCPPDVSVFNLILITSPGTGYTFPLYNFTNSSSFNVSYMSITSEYSSNVLCVRLPTSETYLPFSLYAYNLTFSTSYSYNQYMYLSNATFSQVTFASALAQYIEWPDVSNTSNSITVSITYDALQTYNDANTSRAVSFGYSKLTVTDITGFDEFVFSTDHWVLTSQSSSTVNNISIALAKSVSLEMIDEFSSASPLYFSSDSSSINYSAAAITASTTPILTMIVHGYVIVDGTFYNSTLVDQSKILIDYYNYTIEFQFISETSPYMYMEGSSSNISYSISDDYITSIMGGTGELSFSTHDSLGNVEGVSASVGNVTFTANTTLIVESDSSSTTESYLKFAGSTLKEGVTLSVDGMKMNGPVTLYPGSRILPNSFKSSSISSYVWSDSSSSSYNWTFYWNFEASSLPNFIYSYTSTTSQPNAPSGLVFYFKYDDPDNASATLFNKFFPNTSVYYNLVSGFLSESQCSTFLNSIKFYQKFSSCDLFKYNTANFSLSCVTGDSTYGTIWAGRANITVSANSINGVSLANGVTVPQATQTQAPATTEAAESENGAALTGGVFGGVCGAVIIVVISISIAVARKAKKAAISESKKGSNSGNVLLSSQSGSSSGSGSDD